MAHQDGNLERKISLTVPEDQSQPPSSAVKELSRRQLKDLLTDVYASKARTDRRQASSLLVLGFLCDIWGTVQAALELQCRFCCQAKGC